MPILEVSLLENKLNQDITEIDPAAQFSVMAGIDNSLVTISTHLMQNCYGNSYQCMAHLYLPDLWSNQKITEMQNAAAQLISEAWGIQPGKIIVMVHTIPSGQVLDRGSIQVW